MLTEDGLRQLLAEGAKTHDQAFANNFVEHMRRTVYLMTRFLAERQYRFLSSVELQDRIDEHLRRKGVRPVQAVFNPVAWFSEQWTVAGSGRATQYYQEEYRELFDRQGDSPTSYRIQPAWHESVVRILSDLRRAEEAEEWRRVIEEQLDHEGAFDPGSNLEEARRRVLRAVAVRQGQPQFRDALLAAYEGHCAITGYDAAPGLEAAHIKPYDGPHTNAVNNGILLLADIHALFDQDLLAIDPNSGLVCISRQLRNTAYWEFNGRQLWWPHDPLKSPSQDALEWRWTHFLR